MVDTGRGGRRQQSENFGISAIRLCLLIAAASLLCFGFGSLLGYLTYGGPSAAASQRPSSKPVVGQKPRVAPSGPPDIIHICTDTCSTAKNGVCDEGRNASGLVNGIRVYCDLGTDCADCGVFYGSPARAISSDHGPVAHLVDAGTAVHAKMTKTEPAFIMAHTDPKLDVDVSEVITRTGVVEGGITQVFYEALKGGCIKPDGSRALVLDVGANFGYFSVYSAKLGCRVIAWEPVPLYAAFIRYNLQLNNVSHLVEVRGRVVGDQDDKVLEVQVPTKGNWGTASVTGISQYQSQEPRSIKVQSERLDTVVQEEVLLAKVDVEGFEPSAFKGMKGLLATSKIHNLIMEYSPGIAERLFPAVDVMEEVPGMLKQLLDLGFRIMQLDDNYGKAGHIAYDEGIPALPEVTQANLKYDLQDAQVFRKTMLACPKPEALFKFQAGQWQACNMMPEDAHPKSFRSLFHHNTNIWAVHPKAATMQLVKRSHVVGVFPLSQDARYTWTSQSNPQQGIGSRVCKYLQPDMLVRSRCNCSFAAAAGGDKLKACLEEEALVMQFVKQGKMPYAP